MTTLVEVDNLVKHFGSLQAVRGLSFNVDRGDVFGFLGPNGAGKSTTMKMITGFLEPTSGNVRVCGHDMQTDALAGKRSIGYLPEGAPLYGEMTTKGFLEFIADVRGLTGTQRQARIEDVVERIHLEGVLYQRVETLSKGFKRRVGLAQAVLHDPEVLILDEPTDGLDPNQKHEVRSLINEMAKDKAIIISTHILEEVEAICSKAIIIASGQLVFAGTPAELASRSERHNAVQVRVAANGSGDTLKNQLAAVAGVASVSALDDDDAIEAYDVFAQPGQSIATGVADVLNQSGRAVHGMRIEAGRLDDVFRSITREQGKT